MERFFQDNLSGKEIFVRSAGTYYGYPMKVNEEILSWATHILVADLSHKHFIYEHYPAHINKVRVIGLSDEYERDSFDLLVLLDYWFNDKEQFKTEEWKNWNFLL
jgi:predicted protein tyrosine phosphatase